MNWMLYLGLFKYVHIHTFIQGQLVKKSSNELEGECWGVNGRFGAEKEKGEMLWLYYNPRNKIKYLKSITINLH